MPALLESPENIVLEMQGIRKSFPGVTANDGVQLRLRRGEIHALLGENGAGKSTLMSVLVGLYRPDSGSIAVRGTPVVMRNPRRALRLGICMVHQHFLQSQRHTALQNIALGHAYLRLFPRWSRIRGQVERAAQKYGLGLDLDAPIALMPVGERQKVEILRALFHGASILVLDEPTAVLSRQETEILFQVLRSFAAEGGSVIFISHKLDEVLDIAHRVTVMRKGRTVFSGPMAGMDAPRLARLMVGRDIHPQQRKARDLSGPTVLSLRDVSVRASGPLPSLRQVSFHLKKGEILGMAGVSGSGQRTLAHLLAGLQRHHAGSFQLFGRPAPVGDVRAFTRMGVAHVPQDRNRTGLASGLSVMENLVLKHYRQLFCRRGIMAWDRARAWSVERIQELDIQCPGPGARTASLSGGNVQKVILARELAVRRPQDSAPRLVVAAYPCRGLDVGAAQELRRRLLASRDLGSAVLLISEDLDELFSLSDRIGVLFRGRLLGLYPREQLSRELVGLMMGGHVPPHLELGKGESEP